MDGEPTSIGLLFIRITGGEESHDRCSTLPRVGYANSERADSTQWCWRATTWVPRLGQDADTRPKGNGVAGSKRPDRRSAYDIPIAASAWPHVRCGGCRWGLWLSRNRSVSSFALYTGFQPMCRPRESSRLALFLRAAHRLVWCSRGPRCRPTSRCGCLYGRRG